MKQFISFFFWGILLFIGGGLYAQVDYFPAANSVWEERSAASLQLNEKALNAAVKFAAKNEYNNLRIPRKSN